MSDHRTDTTGQSVVSNLKYCTTCVHTCLQTHDTHTNKKHALQPRPLANTRPHQLYVRTILTQLMVMWSLCTHTCQNLGPMFKILQEKESDVMGCVWCSFASSCKFPVKPQDPNWGWASPSFKFQSYLLHTLNDDFKWWFKWCHRGH